MAIPNGFITIENTEKGTHKVVKIKTVRNGQLKGKRIIALKDGHEFFGFGFVNENGKISVWSKFRTENQKSLQEWIARCLFSMCSERSDFRQVYADKGVQLHVEKRCLRCNRQLTDPESIQRGIGPECIKMGMN